MWPRGALLLRTAAGVAAWCRPAQHLIHWLGFLPQAALTYLVSVPGWFLPLWCPGSNQPQRVCPGEPAVCTLWRASRGNRTGSNFRPNHNSWLKPNMTDLPLGRLFHLLFNACNKYLHDPALEGTLCDNSCVSLPNTTTIGWLQQRIFHAILREAGRWPSGRKHSCVHLQRGEEGAGRPRSRSN